MYLIALFVLGGMQLAIMSMDSWVTCGGIRSIHPYISTRPPEKELCVHLVNATNVLDALPSVREANMEAMGTGKYVHHVHEVVMGGKFVEWIASWVACYPDHKHILWTMPKIKQYLHSRRPMLLEALGNHDPIFTLDAVRYVFLEEYGGIYADTDFECHRPFLDIINDPIAFVESDYSGEPIQNSLMVALAPHHAFWGYVEAELALRIRNVHADVLWATGPKLLYDVFVRWSGPADILPAKYFWNGTYATHHSTGSWVWRWHARKLRWWLTPINGIAFTMLLGYSMWKRGWLQYVPH